MAKSLEDILASVQPEAMRKALEDKRSQFMQMLAEAVVLYQMNECNPRLKGDEKKAALKGHAATVEKWQWAIENIDERLNGADKALRGS